MDNKQYTIKDIAQMAGVSAGTVDRVIHSRGEVSASSREKVERILQEINYQPNMYAIGLARKKKYHFGCFMPKYEPNDYWHSVAKGIGKAMDEVAPFNISLDYIFYDHSNKVSYVAAGKRMLSKEFDAVLIAPNYTEETLEITAKLQERGIPFVFIDVNVEDAGALGYIGQDSFRSGNITARIMHAMGLRGDEVALFHSESDTNSLEIQMQHRLEGFNAYLEEEHIHIILHDVELKKDPDETRHILEELFVKYPGIKAGVVFNSRIYRVGEFLKESGVPVKILAGYDLLPRNVALLKEGMVSFLIGQRPSMQGYAGIKMLTDKVVFKRDVPQRCYMPVDILIKENIDYYVESYNL